MASKIQLRRDLAASWTSTNPTLASGEPGLETDTGYIKYGDGTSTWTALPYAMSAATTPSSLSLNGGPSVTLNNEGPVGGVDISTGTILWFDRDINGDTNGMAIGSGEYEFSNGYMSFMISENDPMILGGGGVQILEYAGGAAIFVGNTNETGNVDAWRDSSTMTGIVRIQVPTQNTGELTLNTWTFLNNGLVFPDGTVQTTAGGGGSGTNFNTSNIAIGLGAGVDQRSGTIAIGQDAAGTGTQNLHAIAIGRSAGYAGQGNSAIAIGHNASGAHDVYGNNTSTQVQSENSIVISALGSTPLYDAGSNTFVVKPIRSNVGPNTLYYDYNSGEITYGSPGSIDGGVADNSVCITFVSFNDSGMSGSGAITVGYNIAISGATSAGVLLVGLTTNHTQNATGATDSQGDNSFTFVVDYQLWYNVVNIIPYVVDSRGYTFYSTPSTQELPGGPCLVEGTEITMADGSRKAIEDIAHGELIRVWNFDLGEFSEAQPLWIKHVEETTAHHRFTFSDGTVLDTVGHHVFNKQAGKFTYLIKDETPVGTTTFNDKGEEITLISKEMINEPVRYYNVWTQYHLNLFANGVLTSNRFNNIYPIVDMKFVKDDRKLRPLNDFAGIDQRYIDGLRLQEQTMDAEYVRQYVDNRLIAMDINNTVEQGI